VIFGKAIKLLETDVLAEGPKSDIVRNVFLVCYLRTGREMRDIVQQEGEEGFIP